jgi:hypothetical protein
VDSSLNRATALVQAGWAHVGGGGGEELLVRAEDGDFLLNTLPPRSVGRMFDEDALLLPKGRQRQDHVDVSRSGATVLAFHETREYRSDGVCSPEAIALGIASIEHFLLDSMQMHDEE